MTIRANKQIRRILVLSMMCSSLLAGALSAPDAKARPAYGKEFLESYPEFAKNQGKKKRCLACHSGKNKKTRNHYGQALAKALGAKNVKNQAVIVAAFKQIEDKSCADSDTKWKERLDEGEFPCPHGRDRHGPQRHHGYIQRLLSAPDDH